MTKTNGVCGFEFFNERAAQCLSFPVVIHSPHDVIRPLSAVLQRQPDVLADDAQAKGGKAAEEHDREHDRRVPQHLGIPGQS